jgi:hypothetical protein
VETVCIEVVLYDGDQVDPVEDADLLQSRHRNATAGWYDRSKERPPSPCSLQNTGFP